MCRRRLQILTDCQYFASGIVHVAHQLRDLFVRFPKTDHEACFRVDVGTLFVTVPQHRERTVVFCLRTDGVI